MTVPDAAAALLAGITKGGMTYGINPDMVHHVLAVLEDADMAVVALPPASGKRVTPAGVRIAEFDGVVGVSFYPEDGTWRVYEIHDRCFWDHDDDPLRVAAAIVAAVRWAQREKRRR